LPAFDPRRAGRRTFISRIIENHAHTLTQARYAAKRDPRREAGSLDCQIDPHDLESDSHRDYVDEDTYYAGLRGSTPVEAKHDLEISLSVAMNQMPQPLRQVCKLMYEGYTMTDIAQILNIHRSTVDDRKAEIRRRLRAAGFE